MLRSILGVQCALLAADYVFGSVSVAAMTLARSLPSSWTSSPPRRIRETLCRDHLDAVENTGLGMMRWGADSWASFSFFLVGDDAVICHAKVEV